MSGAKKKTAPTDITTGETSDDQLDSRLTIGNTDPAKFYFVYFIHELGRHGDNMPIKVGASNDVIEKRKQMERDRENNLKIHVAIKCLRGDAEEVMTQFVKKYGGNHIQNGWFTGGKPIVDAFVAEMEKMGYEKLTEGRARLLKGGARKKVPNAKSTENNDMSLILDIPAPAKPTVPQPKTRAKKQPV